MKVLVLVHSSLVPPNTHLTRGERESAAFKTEYDIVNGLREAGHEVETLGVSDELKPIREALDKFKPKIVFNLLEEFAGEAIYDQNVVSYLELMGVSYTGCGPRGLMLARDKALAKKLLTYHRILNPNFYLFPRSARAHIHLPKTLRYPLFVKSANEDASLGITQDSIVHTSDQLIERVKYFHEKHESDALAETYIEGREIYVAIMGNKRLQVLPPRELVFNNVSDRVPRIATSKVKFDGEYRKKFGITTVPVKYLNKLVESQLPRICKRAYNALSITGYARVDLRLNENNELYVIEVNPNPDISFKEDFADSALAGGFKYPDLLNRLIAIGLNRN